MNSSNKLSKFLRKLFKMEGLKLGSIKNAVFQSEYLTDQELNHHVHIVGASGFGKTVLLTKIMKDRIRKGQGCLWLDMKGDRESIDSMISFIKEVGREKDLQIFSISHPDLSGSYNLVFEGNATEIRDKIISSMNWSEEFYKSQTMSYLLKLLIVLVWLRDNRSLPFDLHTIYQGSTSDEFLLGLSQKVPDEEMDLKKLIEGCYVFLIAKTGLHNLSGFNAQLESLLLADFGRFLKETASGIRLFDSVNSQKIVFIFLDSRRYREAAVSMAKMLVKDLVSTSAKVDGEVAKKDRKPFVCFIDEFADIADESFTSFPDRARSSKMSLVLSHQDLSDLKRISEEFYSRMTANMATLYAFLQSVPGSADEISKRGGTKTVWKETYKAEAFWFFSIKTGDRSLREAEEFRVHPNVVKSLRVGECVVVKKYPHARAYVVRVDEK